jgi:hypothetical protein
MEYAKKTNSPLQKLETFKCKNSTGKMEHEKQKYKGISERHATNGMCMVVNVENSV